MAAIDDAINSLSSDELDTLNSDPKLLSDFKAKYSPVSNPPSSLDEAKDIATSMPGLLGHLGREIVNTPQDIVNNLKGAATLGAGALYGEVDPVGALADLAKSTPDLISSTKQSITDTAKHPIQAIEKNPVSTALTIGGLASLTPETGGIEGELGSFADDLKQDSGLAKFNKKLLGVSESATKMGGQNIPIPSQSDIDTAVDNVIQAHKDVVNSFGEDLNDARAAHDLPTTPQEESTSNRRYGNIYNLNISKPLELPDNLTQNAPKMEGMTPKPDLPIIDPANVPTDKPYGLYIGTTKFGDAAVDYYDIHGSGGPISDTNKMPTMGVSSTEDLNNLDKQGITILGKKARAGNQVPEIPYGEYITQPKQPIMPFKISPTELSDPQKLDTEIDRFLKNQDYINNSSKIKAASFYQDQIKPLLPQTNGQPDFDKPGDVFQGLLKGKYNDLKQVIQNSSPELQQAKSNFAQMKQALNLVSDKLDPDQPGKTQDFLRRVFTSDAQSANDQRQQLAYLEQLSGQPVISNLFKQFAGKEFGQYIGPTGERLIKRSLPYAVGGALFGHPGIGIGGVAAEGALTSPKLIGTAESLIPDIATKIAPTAAIEGALKGYRPFNTPELQSLKDKLKNVSPE